MQHMSPRRLANGLTNGVNHGGYDAEAAKVAATATQQVVQGLKATAAAFIPGSQATTQATNGAVNGSAVASVGDC